MNTRRIWIATLASILIGTSLIMVSGAPGSSRLPWSDNEELLRLLVMGPGAEAPIKEYFLQAIEAIEEDHILELESLGIDVLSVRGQSAVVRGALTEFSEISGEGLPWIKSVLPHLKMNYSEGPEFDTLTMERVFSACNLEQLQSLEAGDGLSVAVIDLGFTGELEDLLGADRVHYVKFPDSNGLEVSSAQLVEGRLSHRHGTMCAEAIAATAPEAEFILFSYETQHDRLDFMELIAEGAEVVVNGRTIKLSDIDVISDSTGVVVPDDHSDGTGELAQMADRVVASGIPYVYALGNYGEGESTTSTYYGSVFEDNDGNLLHDFDPLTDSMNDANSVSITLDPWEGNEPAEVTVVLEWDGWPYQLRTGSLGVWTSEEIVRTQDIDLDVYYEDPHTGLLALVARSNINQFMSLSSSDSLYTIAPVEAVIFPVYQPGTYLLVVRNYTPDHSSNLEVRAVDFHMWVYSRGTYFSIEHHTATGALLGVGGANDILSVGAVGLSVETESWCLRPYSSQGPTSDGRMKPEIVAPTSFLSAWRGYLSTGTSASTPVVAGIVALLRGAVPESTPQMIREALCQTSQRLPGACNDFPGPFSCMSCQDACNYGVGWGMVDAWEAYVYLKNATD